MVDDDPNDARLALAAFARSSLDEQVTLVTDGSLALAYLYGRAPFDSVPRPNPPSVVLLDLKLPVIDGFEVLRQIKEDPALKSLPVVVLTSSREVRDVTRAYGLGANGYMVKVIDFDRYCSALEVAGRFWTAVNEPPPRWRGPEPMEDSWTDTASG
ncbi:MAG: response regulator [Candidatus Eisenbacteria bacterium]|nr:response regulator [Candidatus Eisenbacteria bacterium]